MRWGLFDFRSNIVIGIAVAEGETIRSEFPWQQIRFSGIAISACHSASSGRELHGKFSLAVIHLIGGTTLMRSPLVNLSKGEVALLSPNSGFQRGFKFKNDFRSPKMSPINTSPTIRPPTGPRRVGVVFLSSSVFLPLVSCLHWFWASASM